MLTPDQTLEASDGKLITFLLPLGTLWLSGMKSSHFRLSKVYLNLNLFRRCNFFSRLATTNSSVLCFIGSNNGGIYIFVFICTMKYLNFKLRQENTFILSEKMCRNCSGFQEFYHTSQLFILLSSGQTFTYPSDCFFFFFLLDEWKWSK